MVISSFNINKFCGTYSFNGQYYNPKNIDFKNPTKEFVCSLLKNEEDIFFLQEFCDNQYIKIETLFPEDKYKIFYNSDKKTKSDVVAITLKNSSWETDKVLIHECNNKFIKMKLNKLAIVSFHNTNKFISDEIEKYFNSNIDVQPDIILGDFNDIEWVKTLHKNKEYKDLVTDDMITFKPAQSAIDRIFVKSTDDFNNKIVFNGIVETFLSDHNILTFSLNI